MKDKAKVLVVEDPRFGIRGLLFFAQVRCGVHYNCDSVTPINAVLWRALKYNLNRLPE